MRNVLMCGAILAVTAVAIAAPTDKETKKARKKLKSNAKKLNRTLGSFMKNDSTAREGKNAEQREKAEKANEELAEKIAPLIELVAKANNDDAAEALVTFASVCPADRAVETCMDELGRMESDEAIEAMAAVLGGDLVEARGKKKRKKKKKKRRGKKGGPAPWYPQVLVARVFKDMSHKATIDPIAAQLAKGTQPEVVNACVAAASNKEDKKVVDALISLLGRVEKQGGREYFNVRQALVDLTGMDFFTKKKWNEWWSTGRDSFDFSKKGETKEAATRSRGDKEKRPTFFGSEIESNRLLFVIDVSGSMKMTDQTGESTMSPEDFVRANPDSPEIRKMQRIERARRQVIGAIKNMVPTQKFNIIAFSSTLKYWRKPTEGLAAANDASKAAAIKWTEGLVEGGGTHTDNALRAAFDHEGIDTIYFLSDGAPMKKVGNPGEQAKQFAEEEIRHCLYLVKQLNRFRGVKIHSFGMDGPGVWHRKWGNRPVTLPLEEKWLTPLQQFMRDIASQNGGEYKSI